MIKIYQLMLNVFLFFVFIVILQNNAFALDDDKKTIKQLKNNIEVLKSEKVITFSEFEKFKQNNGELSDYFSKNI
jgi:cell division protein FtsB